MWSAGYDKKGSCKKKSRNGLKQAENCHKKTTQAVRGAVMEFLSDAGGHISERSGLFA